jgi:methionyl-tRNA formyltransferase
MGVDGMVEVVAAIDAGTATLTPQSEAGASHQGLVDDAVARIDLGWDVDTVDRRIRGCDPSPGAWLEHAGVPVRLFGSSVASRAESAAAPGTVLEVGEGGLELALRGGSIRVQKLRTAAGKVPAAQAGLAAGDVLS